jgi:hypothetical protein
LLIPTGAQPVAGQPDFLADAQAAYLQGHWEETEILLRRQLDHYPDDIAAGLLFATLLRHQGKREASKQQLRDLRRWDAAQHWAFEIDRLAATLENWQSEDSEELADNLQ